MTSSKVSERTDQPPRVRESAGDAVSHPSAEAENPHGFIGYLVADEQRTERARRLLFPVVWAGLFVCAFVTLAVTLVVVNSPVAAGATGLTGVAALGFAMVRRFAPVRRRRQR